MVDMLAEEPIAPTRHVDKPVDAVETVESLSTPIPGQCLAANDPTSGLELPKTFSAHHEEKSSSDAQEKGQNATDEVNGEAFPAMKAGDVPVGYAQAQGTHFPPLPEVPDADVLESQTEVKALRGQLTALLARLEKVEANPMLLPTPSSHVDHPDAQAGIKRLSMDYWKPMNHKGSESLTHDITVYYEELAKDDSAPSGIKCLRPRRIKILSHELRNELASIVGANMTQCPTCFVHPFRPLLHNKAKLEKSAISKRNALNSVKDPLLDPQDIKKDDESVTALAKQASKEKQLSESLDALCAFLSEEMKDEFDLREQLRSGQAATIAHHNLWHLFEPGDLVLKREKKDGGEVLRLYRVHCVSGGRPSLGSQDYVGRPSHAAQYRDAASGQPGNVEVHDTTGGSKFNEDSLPTEGTVPLYLSYHNFFYDGSQVGAVEECHQFKGFRGEQAIKDLKIFPVQYLENSREFLEGLVRRGRRFHGMIKARAAHKEHDGLTADMEQVVTGEVMIDFQEIADNMDLPELSNFVGRLADRRATFEKFDCGLPICPPGGCTRNFDDGLVESIMMMDWWTSHKHETDAVDPAQEELSEHYLMLLTHVVGAYSLHDRKWYELDIDQVKDFQNSDVALQSCFDDVVMDRDNKKLLLALVSQHPSGKASIGRQSSASNEADLSIDFVKGKGKGLIILLHGPPGVGKTLTAETIAVYTRRPLYAITCGDIGQTPKDIEESLERHFKLAHKWGCVLLLDEADVFLAERQPGDVKRNAMVSVFLRVLEYYSGILFLTTNQVGQLDEAFKSRIRIQLHYPKFDLESTLRLWKTHLRRLRENKNFEVPIDFEDDKLLEFAEKHYIETSRENVAWNGRQIRNAFQTAIALAEYGRLQKIKQRAKDDDATEEYIRSKYYKSVKLKVEHFKKVSKTAKTFEKYMKSVKKNKTSSDMAQSKELRNDNFDPNETQNFRRLRRSRTSADSPLSVPDLRTPLSSRRKSVLETPSSQRGRSDNIGSTDVDGHSIISSAGESEDDSQSD